MNYSGESECIICGEVGRYDDFDGEGELVCNDCAPHEYCACCGDRIYDDDSCVTLNGRVYCYACYDELPQCDICGEPFDDSNDPLSGLKFVMSIADEDNSTIMMAPADSWHNDTPIVRCVCADCADRAFKDGRPELERRHTGWYQHFRYQEQIPYTRLTEKGLALFGDEEDIEEFISNAEEEIDPNKKEGINLTKEDKALSA